MNASERTAAIQRILADPAREKAEVFAAIRAEEGEKWFAANLRYLEEEWAYAAQLFGLFVE